MLTVPTDASSLACTTVVHAVTGGADPANLVTAVENNELVAALTAVGPLTVHGPGYSVRPADWPKGTDSTALLTTTCRLEVSLRLTSRPARPWAQYTVQS